MTSEIQTRADELRQIASKRDTPNEKPAEVFPLPGGLDPIFGDPVEPGRAEAC